MTSSREQVVARYGTDSIAVSTLHPELDTFTTPAGYLALRRARGFDIVLGPPMCAPEARQALLGQFLASSRRPFFAYLDGDTATLLRRMAPRRFFFAGIGVERVLELAGPTEPLHREVQGALRKAARAGLHLEPAAFSTLTPRQRAHLEGITERFVRRSQTGCELRFINRPACFAPDAPGRLFLLRQGAEEPFGYLVLDPYLLADGRRAYLFNQLRFDPTRLWGVYLACVAKVMQVLRQEGVAELSLGVCPMHRLHTPPELRTSALVDWQMRLLAWRRSHFYDLGPLERMKGLFAGREQQRYVALPTRSILGPLLALLEVSGVTWGGMARAQRERSRAHKAPREPVVAPKAPPADSAEPPPRLRRTG